MSIKDGAYANFRRALDTQDLTIIRSAAAEIPQVPLDHALRICLILRGAEPAAYDRAVLRWLARFARQKAFSLGQLNVAIAARALVRASRPERAPAAGSAGPDTVLDQSGCSLVGGFR